MRRHSSPHLLIVEDDTRLATLLAQVFAASGFSVGVEDHGGRAISRIAEEQPDVVILDVKLPGASGFDVCRQVRPNYRGGIVMLTAHRKEADHARGLELGADDYVLKPVHPRLLLARIRSLLRRLDGSSAAEPAPSEIAVGALTARRRSREVRVAGRDVELTTSEFNVLWVLARQAGEIVSRDQLYREVRGIDYDGLDRSIDVHVSRLRRKLKAAGLDPETLKSVRSSGYLLVVN